MNNICILLKPYLNLHHQQEEKENMIKKKIFPTLCPSCGSELKVHSLHCHTCDTTITGEYKIPAIQRLSPDEQIFITNFVKCSGSLKQMATDMHLSYPTVRNILDDIIEKLKNLENHESTH